MLVGYLPHLNRLVALLVCGDVSQTVVDCSAGTLACLENVLFERLGSALGHCT